jgi:hypothetical protein
VSAQVLVDARCSDHRRTIGVVVLSGEGEGFPSWEARHRGRPSSDPVTDHRFAHRDTLFVHLRETSLTEVEGWCRDCRATRRVMVVDLLAAIHPGRRPVVLA